MKLSIIVPGIRTHLWDRFCKSVEESCIDYSYEIIFVGPFLPPAGILKENIIYLHSYSPVPVCIQKATLLARGEFVCHGVDDSEYIKGTLDKCLNLASSLSKDDALSLTYIENTNRMNSADRWMVANLPEFHLPYISKGWATFVQPLMYRDRFFELGGFNCEFEYSNHCHHDLAFRLQLTGGKVYLPNFTVSVAEHMPERTGDHGPIHDSQTTIDTIKFNDLWSKETNPYILYDNWIEKDKPWKRRFKKLYKSYTDLAQGENYNV